MILHGRWCGESSGLQPGKWDLFMKGFLTDAWRMCQANKTAEEYGGDKPFSEPESRIVRLVAESSHARSFVNLHAGEWALYIPWDSQNSAAADLPVRRAGLFSVLVVAACPQAGHKCRPSCIGAHSSAHDFHPCAMWGHSPGPSCLCRRTSVRFWKSSTCIANACLVPAAKCPGMCLPPGDHSWVW